MIERSPDEGIFRVGAITRGPLTEEHYARVSSIKIETAAKPCRFRLLTYRVINWLSFPDDLIKMEQYQDYVVNGVGDETGFSFYVNNENISDHDLEELCIDHFLNDVLMGKRVDPYQLLFDRLTYKQRLQRHWILKVSDGRPSIELKMPMHTHTLQSVRGLPVVVLGSVVTLMLDGVKKSYSEEYGESGDWFERVHVTAARPVNVVRVKTLVSPAPKPRLRRYPRNKP